MFKKSQRNIFLKANMNKNVDMIEQKILPHQHQLILVNNWYEFKSENGKLQNMFPYKLKIRKQKGR